MVENYPPSPFLYGERHVCRIPRVDTYERQSGGVHTPPAAVGAAVAFALACALLLFLEGWVSGGAGVLLVGGVMALIALGWSVGGTAARVANVAVVVLVPAMVFAWRRRGASEVGLLSLVSVALLLALTGSSGEQVTIAAGLVLWPPGVFLARRGPVDLRDPAWLGTASVWSLMVVWFLLGLDRGPAPWFLAAAVLAGLVFLGLSMAGRWRGETLSLRAHRTAVRRLVLSPETSLEDPWVERFPEFGVITAVMRMALYVRTVADLERYLEKVCADICRSLGYPTVSVGLYDQVAGEVAIVAHWPQDVSLAAVKFERGRGLSGWVVDHELPVTVGDVSRDERFVLSVHGTVSEIVVPLKGRDRVLGVLIADSALPDAFSPRDVGLMEAMAGAVAAAIEVGELHRQVQEQAIRDPLTGVYNRREFHVRLQQEIARSDRVCTPVTVCLMDLDRLKQTNDSRGHLAGDQLLVLLARVLTLHCRPSDVVSRWGGDEFALIFPESDRQMAQGVLHRTLAVLAREGGAEVSYGLASYPDEAQDAQGLLARADQEMYAMKRMHHRAAASSTEIWDQAQTDKASEVPGEPSGA